MQNKLIIAIDGPAGAGKGTIGRYLSKIYPLKLLETGLLYRFVAYNALNNNLDLNCEDSITRLAKTINFNDLEKNKLGENELRHESIGNAASKVATLKNVRGILTEYMRHFSLNLEEPYRGVILDGRDIGTVVCPGANLKLFITANAEIRSKRRHKEMLDKEMLNSSFAETNTAKNLLQRDKRDELRPNDPLKMSKDAHLIDTSDLTIKQACELAASFVATLFCKD